MNITKVQKTLFLWLLLAITVMFVWLITPFLQPIFWAAVLAVVFFPVQQWWLRATKDHKGVSAMLSLITIFIIVLIPLYFIVQAIIHESISLYSTVSHTVHGGGISIEEQLRPITQYLDTQFGITPTQTVSKAQEMVQAFGSFITAKAVDFGQDVFAFGIQFFVMLYILYYFLKEGSGLVNKLIHVLPLGDARERKLLRKLTTTTRATIKGTLIIGVIQGVLGGLLFAVVGINNPVLWGAVMTVLSIIPALGTGIVWGPAGILLLIGGHLWQGILVIAVGTVIIGLVDNLLRPILVGKDTEMPDALVLLSTLGGLSLMGISGFVIGPVIAAFFLSVWQMFEEEHRKELEELG